MDNGEASPHPTVAETAKTEPQPDVKSLFPDTLDRKTLDQQVSNFMRLAYAGGLSQVQATQLLQEQMGKLLTTATTDYLTGLPNARIFDHDLNREFRAAERTDRPISLLFIDADLFGVINKRYNQATGDAALKQIAWVLENAASRPGDVIRRINKNSRVTGQESGDGEVVSRRGGEEFEILLSETHAAGAEVVARRIQDLYTAVQLHPDIIEKWPAGNSAKALAAQATILENFHKHQAELQTNPEAYFGSYPKEVEGMQTLSIGIATREEGMGLEQFRKAADNATQHAKNVTKSVREVAQDKWLDSKSLTRNDIKEAKDFPHFNVKGNIARYEHGKIHLLPASEALPLPVLQPAQARSTA